MSMNGIASSCKRIICLLLLWLCSQVAMTQEYITPSFGNTSITACSGTLYDPGGRGYYQYPCDGYIVIYPQNEGCRVHLEGDYDTGDRSEGRPVSATITIYDGVGRSGTILADVGRRGQLSVTSTSGPLTVYFHASRAVQNPGFEFAISCVEGCNCAVPAVNASVGTHSVNLSWNEREDASQYIIEYGYAGFTLGTGTILITDTNDYTIGNLDEDTNYDFYVYYDCDNDGVLTDEIPGSVAAHVPYGELILVPTSGCDTIITCSATILDPGGYSSYPENCDGYLIVQPDGDGCFIEIEGYYSIYYDGEASEDYLIIYDGADTSGTELFNSNNNDNGFIHEISSSGSLMLYFHSDQYASPYYTGFELYVHCIGGCSCGESPYNVVANTTNNGIEISWAVPADTTTYGYFVEYGPEGFTRGTGTIIYVADTSYEIVGLQTSSHYDVYVYYDCGNDGVLTDENPTLISFFVSDEIPCIDLSDLSNPNITCTISNEVTSGDYDNPYSSVEIVNYGSESARSRHTIHRCHLTDLRTGHQLQVIPPGGLYSVRLGNWLNAEGSESISYDFQVDTANADIILLKYAAVLEDPGHNPSQAARFTLDILDQNGNQVDSYCCSADFRANSLLGWHSFVNDCLEESVILWKDWTNVGVDVSAYHGQTIRVRLTTYECIFDAHYAYAYFTLGCRKKKIIAETCGETISAIYSAPDGFNYEWYYRSNPDNILFTDQTVTVDFLGGEDTLCCWCSYIENSSCGFELTTALESHYPLANFSAERDSCSYTYTFLNGSAISNDGVTPNGSGEHCDGAYWDFGDGTTSTEMNPHHDFQQPGIYSVQLIATLNHDACQDTIIQIIEIPDNTPTITGSSDICRGESATLTAMGGIGYEWSANGEILGTDATITVVPNVTTTYTLHSADTNGCSIKVEHTVAVHDTVAQYFHGVICQGERYGEHGFSVAGTTAPTVIQEAQHLQTQYGCDSIVYLSLTVNPLPNVMLGPDMVHCFERDGAVELSVPEIDCESYLWNTGETSQTVYAPAEGTYSVIAVKNGCENSDEVTISDVCEFQIYLPNCITPSTDDGVNDYFCLPTTKDIKEIEVGIFDRWGMVIFSSNDPHFRWDGTVNGKLCVDMVFVYRIEIITTSEQKHILKGTVTVL